MSPSPQVHFFLKQHQVGCLISMSVVLYFHDKALAIYIGTSLFGLFISSVFPSTLALAELYINVTGGLIFSQHYWSTKKLLYKFELLLTRLLNSVLAISGGKSNCRRKLKYQRQFFSSERFMVVVYSIWLRFDFFTFQYKIDRLGASFVI